MHLVVHWTVQSLVAAEVRKVDLSDRRQQGRQSRHVIEVPRSLPSLYRGIVVSKEPHSCKAVWAGPQIEALLYGVELQRPPMDQIRQKGCWNWATDRSVIAVCSEVRRGVTLDW